MQTDLPVWTIRPNWRGGILERLEWLTDVLTSSSGAEQRRAVRLSPRRSIEFTVNPTNRERTYLDLLLHRLGSATWLVPVWFDKGRLTERVFIGGNRVPFDTTYREHTPGTLALLHRDAFTWEVVSISAVDDDGVTLDVPLDQEWGPGTAIYPLRESLIMGETSLAALTSRVGESVLLFRMNGANDWPAEMPDDLMFEGLPVMTQAPDRKSSITTDHTRLHADRDGQVGLVHRVASIDRAFAVQSHSWMRHGRRAQAEFRSMLYWLNGRQRAVLLPSFNEDVVVSRNANAAALNLDIEKVGFSYVGVVPGRELLKVGSNILRITEVGLPQSPQEERLRIGAGLPVAIPKGRQGAFVDAARLNQDAIEITHHADTDGAMECSVTFRTFANTRETDGTIYLPIPAAAMTPGPCGGSVRVVDLNARVNAATTAAGGLAKGITLDGFSPSDVLWLSLPSGQTFVAWSPWGVPSPPNYPGSGSMNWFNVIFDGDPSKVVLVGEESPATTYDGYEAARAAFIPTALTGYSSYTFFILDSPTTDNTGGLSIQVDVI